MAPLYAPTNFCTPVGENKGVGAQGFPQVPRGAGKVPNLLLNHRDPAPWVLIGVRKPRAALAKRDVFFVCALMRGVDATRKPANQHPTHQLPTQWNHKHTAKSESCMLLHMLAIPA